MTILRNLLAARDIQSVEAGGTLAPGQSAFCAKICSKIITAQFCCVLLNNEEASGREIPNANVNMEYGLMLGFNKYVVPFQRTSQKLPFNVAGLDTVKYDDHDFESLAVHAIDQAIEATRQEFPAPATPDQVLQTFLLARRALIAPLDTEGERNLYNLGQPLGFNLLNDFSGMEVIYFGNFTPLRAETVLWRLRMLEEILSGRASTLFFRVQAGIMSATQMNLAVQVFSRLQIWVLVTSADDKRQISEELTKNPLAHTVEAFCIHDIWSELAQSSERSLDGAKRNPG